MRNHLYCDGFSSSSTLSTLYIRSFFYPFSVLLVKSQICFFQNLGAIFHSDCGSVERDMIIVCFAPLAVGIIAIVSCSHTVVFLDESFGFLHVVGAAEHFYDPFHPRRHIGVNKHVETFILVFKHVVRATSDDNARSVFCDFFNRVRLASVNLGFDIFKVVYKVSASHTRRESKR